MLPLLFTVWATLSSVMGATGSGKTTVRCSHNHEPHLQRLNVGLLFVIVRDRQFINLASNSNLRTSGSLRSCTDTVSATVQFDVDGRKVILVDTPGFDDTTKSDSDILKLIADFLANS